MPILLPFFILSLRLAFPFECLASFKYATHGCRTTVYSKQQQLQYSFFYWDMLLFSSLSIATVSHTGEYHDERKTRDNFFRMLKCLCGSLTRMLRAHAQPSSTPPLSEHRTNFSLNPSWSRSNVKQPEAGPHSNSKPNAWKQLKRSETHTHTHAHSVSLLAPAAFTCTTNSFPHFIIAAQWQSDRISCTLDSTASSIRINQRLLNNYHVFLMIRPLRFFFDVHLIFYSPLIWSRAFFLVDFLSTQCEITMN